MAYLLDGFGGTQTKRLSHFAPDRFLIRQTVAGTEGRPASAIASSASS
jgi:hypothetical protein